MNKLMAFAFLIVVLVGCSSSKNTTITDSCLSIADQVEQDKCYYTLAVEELNLSLCDKVQEGWYVQTSSKTGYTIGKDNCADEINCILHLNLLGLTNETDFKGISDRNVCDTLQQTGCNKRLYDTCYLRIAVDSKNISGCTEIEPDWYGGGGPKLDYSFRQECYNKVAIAGKHVSFCKSIDDLPLYESRMIDFCILEFAETSFNAEQCSMIDYNETRWQCYSFFANKTADLFYCEKIEHEDFYYPACLISVAEQNKDVSICSTIEIDYWRSSCHEKLGILLDDTSICDKSMTEYRDRARCYTGIAINRKDTTLCESMPDQDEFSRMVCFEGIAVVSKDKKICDRIPNDGWREDCVRNVDTGIVY
jgi:hypothetical protein